MPTITDLKFQKRNASRVSIFLDGQYAFGVQASVAARLSCGQSLTDEEIANLERGDDDHRCYLAGIRYLSFRARSRTEIRRHLTQKGFESDAVHQTLDRLANENYIDDADFARQWARGRQRSRPRSAYALQYELRGKGVSDPDIAVALMDVDDRAAARSAALKKARQLAGLESKKFEIKLMRFLAGRGFSGGICRETARWILDRQARDAEVEHIG
jgi:regulatory protein